MENESLNNKSSGNWDSTNPNWDYRTFKYKDIKSAVEWLKEYFNKPLKLVEKYPQYKSELRAILINITTYIDYYKKDNIIIYNDWLINKAFQDVMKK